MTPVQMTYVKDSNCKNRTKVPFPALGLRSQLHFCTSPLFHSRPFHQKHTIDLSGEGRNKRRLPRTVALCRGVKFQSRVKRGGTLEGEGEGERGVGERGENKRKEHKEGRFFHSPLAQPPVDTAIPPKESEWYLNPASN